MGYNGIPAVSKTLWGTCAFPQHIAIPWHSASGGRKQTVLPEMRHKRTQRFVLLPAVMWCCEVFEPTLLKWDRMAPHTSTIVAVPEVTAAWHHHSIHSSRSLIPQSSCERRPINHTSEVHCTKNDVFCAHPCRDGWPWATRGCCKEHIHTREGLAASPGTWQLCHIPLLGQSAFLHLPADTYHWGYQPGLTSLPPQKSGRDCSLQAWILNRAVLQRPSHLTWDMPWRYLPEENRIAPQPEAWHSLNQTAWATSLLFFPLDHILVSARHPSLHCFKS